MRAVLTLSANYAETRNHGLFAAPQQADVEQGILQPVQWTRQWYDS